MNPCLSQTFESIGIIVSINNVPYLILSVYRPPNNNTETFLHDVEAYLSQLSIQYYSVSHWIIGGDFNIDLFAKSNYADSFINILMFYNMFPTIFQSTHPSSGTLIDKMFISWPGMIDSHIRSVDVSDHVPMITRVKQDYAIITCSNVVVSRFFNEASLKAFRESLVDYNWDHVYHIKTVDEAIAAFNGILFSKFEMTHPLTLINKVSNFKNFNKPW